ncbi:hypothetical protein C8D72_2431 [Kushneria indalinina DSM 14324]|uniref:Uncharacterized protein n=1 Tax=Kushneria indalinina DSM 14324 TaxID=1122140 RepID=A0A3D9DTU9_9GAMM|nr:hypothetical protein C8D72_2431 [Kushneria indalinina DSM 14324]
MFARALKQAMVSVTLGTIQFLSISTEVSHE